MGTPSSLSRSPSDFSDASVVSLGRSAHTDIDNTSEASHLLGISVHSPQVERTQGNFITVI